MYGAAKDPKADEEWIRCKKCHVWFHDTCAEDNRVLDDGGFFVENCVIRLYTAKFNDLP